jgi:hypothetical protein
MVIPVALAVAGVALTAVALLLLRSLGPRFRLGRLLAAAPTVSIEEAQELARGPAVYIRVSGRVSSDEEFPDENDRPLVFRRTRIEVAQGDGWATVVDEREAVPFGVESRSAFLAIDGAALGDGLVAIPRQASGRVSDLSGDRAGATTGLAPETPVRLNIEQLSAVEHVTACGRVELRNDRPVLTAGLGRPLIVTSLDQPSAMRILASGARRRVAAAAVLVLVGFSLLALAAGLALAGPALGASPSPAPSPVLIDPLDPRAGAGASMTGAPLVALLAVVGGGLLAAGATIAYVRLTALR